MILVVGGDVGTSDPGPHRPQLGSALRRSLYHLGGDPAEPVVSALLARLVLTEKPGLATFLGGTVVLFGLFFLLRGYRAPPEEPSPAEPVGGQPPPQVP
jgi:hypothetical protein